MEWLAEPHVWLALVTLTVLEIVLGIDNLIFISIVSGSLPEPQAGKARRTGLILAIATRLALLASIFWLTHRLTAGLFSVLGNEISVRDLVLIGGGLFLLAKSTREIHSTLEEAEGGPRSAAQRPGARFRRVVLQILALDLIFSLDSVITAIGMAEELWVMAVAVVLAIVFMLRFAKSVSDFVHRHPTVKMLALSFLLLIGIALVADGLDFHIPKGYIYFAMGFSFFVEVMNLRVRGRERAGAEEA